MKRIKLCFGAVLAAGAIHAADYNYSWTAGANPSQTSDGRVKFIYSSDGKIKSLTADTSDGNVVFTGDAMTFDSTSAVITNSSSGEIVFQNAVVAAATLTAVSTYTYKYGGQSDTFLTSEKRVVMPNAKLADWRPVATTMETWSGYVQENWHNPNRSMNVYWLRQLADSVTFQFQSGASGNTSSACVEVELSQEGDDIVARAVPIGWLVTRSSGSGLVPGYDVNNLFSDYQRSNYGFYEGIGTGTTGYGINTIVFARRSTVKFAAATGTTAIGTLVAMGNADVHLLCSANLSTTINVQPKEAYSRVAMRDYTYDWYGQSEKADGEVCFDNYTENDRNIYIWKPSLMAGGTYVVKGTSANTILQIKDLGGLPTNGTLKVQSGGLVYLNGSWKPGPAYGDSKASGISGGTCAMFAENGGVIRHDANYSLGGRRSSSILCLNGGYIDFAGPEAYISYITLKNGAAIRPVSGNSQKMVIGNGNGSQWIVGGYLPSTNGVMTRLIGGSSNKQDAWNITVNDTGNEVDFVQNADVDVRTTQTNAVVNKSGAGTMLMNGSYTGYGAFNIKEGRLLLGKSNGWGNWAPINLTGGATVEAVQNTTNLTLGTINVKSSSSGTLPGYLVIPKGASITIADSKAVYWGRSLSVTMATNALGRATCSLRFLGLRDPQIKSTTVNGRALSACIDADGYVHPVRQIHGLTFMIR